VLAVIIEMHGGAATVLRNLARGLHRYYPGEFQLDLLSIRQSEIGPEDRRLFASLTTLASTVHRDLSRLLQIPSQGIATRNAVRVLEPDVILAIGTYPNLLAPAVAPKVPCILTAHSNTSELLRTYPFRPVLRWLIERRYARHPVIVPSQGAADDLRENFSVQTARVIPHGIDLGRIQALAAEAVDDVPDRPFMVSLGNFFPAKDHATMLRAYSVARSKGLDLELVLVGEGPLLGALQEQSRELGIAGRVHFVGHRDNPYPYLRAAKFFVMSSVFEGFGLAMVEAMALGLACIATDCPSGPGEILEDGALGLLVPPSDPGRLGEAMVKLAGSEELRATLSGGSLRRAEDFGLRRMADNYRQLFLDFRRDKGRSNV